ncbi:MAG: DUF1697 domain-containing protein [Gemmatimonadetes bacterium]|nr:DUF1697 domain-containing protein [Gemmatimonadota bacterium]
MTTLIALLRAVNVTGTGILRMEELRALCTKAGFKDVRTYIQSGNVVLRSSNDAARTKAKLEEIVSRKLGKPCRVLVRTLEELEQVERRNPFPEAKPNFTMVLFLDEAPPKGALKDWKIPGGERLALKGRELYLHFPDGQGKSKLKVPFADIGTGRNLNTVRKLIAMAREMG